MNVINVADVQEGENTLLFVLHHQEETGSQHALSSGWLHGIYLEGLQCENIIHRFESFIWKVSPGRAEFPSTDLIDFLNDEKESPDSADLG